MHFLLVCVPGLLVGQYNLSWFSQISMELFFNLVWCTTPFNPGNLIFYFRIQSSGRLPSLRLVIIVRKVNTPHTKFNFFYINITSRVSRTLEYDINAGAKYVFKLSRCVHFESLKKNPRKNIYFTRHFSF